MMGDVGRDRGQGKRKDRQTREEDGWADEGRGQAGR